MTTGAMIFGMMPVAVKLSEGGEMRAPMAMAVIGGLITSTMLTLVVIPVAYDIIDAVAERLLGHATVVHEGEKNAAGSQGQGPRRGGFVAARAAVRPTVRAKTIQRQDVKGRR
jgi:HAE1 family hydrophobic/amphiphilic exporter-1